MISSQQLVVGWIEFAMAGTILLTATKIIADRLRQPVDRVNLITMSLVASTLVPLLLSFANVPDLRLGLFANDRAQAARVPETPNALLLRTEQPTQLDALEPVRRDIQNLATAITPQSETAPTAFSPDVAASPATGLLRSQVSMWSISAAILLVSHSLAISWFFLQWIVGTVRLRNISRLALAPEQSLLDVWKQVSHGRSGPVRLLVTTEIAAPMVFGWRVFGSRRTSVLVPKSIATGDQSTLRFCLAHEWSHVSRGDLPRWQLIHLCQLLLWHQPLFWMLRRELRLSQDLIADDFAAGVTGDELGRIEYSDLLMSVAKQTTGPRIAGAMTFYDHSSQLSRRVKMLLASGQSLRSRSTQAFFWMSGLSLLTVSLLVGSVRLSAAHAQEGTEDKSIAIGTADSNQSTNNKEQAAKQGQMKIVRGRVINEAGGPVAGAKLWLPLQFQPRRTVQATADDAGHFELTCPADWISSQSRGSVWTVWAYAPGYSIQSQSVNEVIRGKSEREYTIQLPPESDIRFKVLSPEGQPLAGVLVEPKNYKTWAGYEIVPEEMQPVVSARTDEDGFVTLLAIQSDPLFLLEMTNEEFGRQAIRTDRGSNIPVREIRLRTTASIKGQVVGENPDWVRGVELGFTTDNRDEGKDPQGIAVVVTDDEGHFEVPVIASGGPLRTYMNLDPALPVRPLYKSAYLTAGETVQLEIPLVAAPLVHGKVVAKSTGQPVPNATISLGYGGFRQSDRVTTDESGQYQGRALPGDVRIHIISLPDGFMQLGAPWAEPYQVPADVAEFELPTVEVVGTHQVTGQLVDTNDQPLADVTVMSVQGNRRYGFGTTDAEGRFKLYAPDGIETRLDVYIEKRGQKPVTVVQQDPLVVRYDADAREKEMEAERALKPDVVLTGRVLISGEPLAGVNVMLERGVPVIGASPARGGTRYSPVSETKTDASGKYHLTGLKAGDRYQVEIRPPFPAADPTWRHQLPYVQDIPDDAKGELALPDVKLVRLTQSIAGIVVDPDGEPVEGATVTAQLRSGQNLARMTQSGPPPWTKSDHQGRFQLKELPDEPLSVMAYFANPKGGRIRFPAQLNVDMNQQDIRVILDPSLRDEEEQ